MAVLVERSVPRTLFSMAFPMLAGTVAMNAYNLTDTWFISRLGTLPLAAMGFTFPVVMLLACVSRGIGTGVTTLASHAMGRGEGDRAARITTHGLSLAAAVLAAVALVGYFTVGPVFRRLGADEASLPLVGEYMRTWYLGAPIMSLPMLGNGILISTGDSRNASRLMIVGPLINLILDPIMIFGLMGCPAMGIRGAALATVISRCAAAVWLFVLLGRKHRLLALRGWGLADWLGSVRGIMRFAVPATMSMILMPVSATVITRILSGFGNPVVAGAGAAQRIEMFAFVVPMALGISLTPFVSQNFGAGRLDRIREAQRVASGFAMAYGALVAVAFFLAAPWMAARFSDDPAVVPTLVAYVRIISFGYGMMEVHRYCGFFLTGMHRPLEATVLNGVRVLVLLIPLSLLGAHFWGIRGVFTARLATDLAAGSLGLVWVARMLRAACAAKT